MNTKVLLPIFLVLSLMAIFSFNSNAYASGKIINKRNPVCTKVLNNFESKTFKNKAGFIAYWQQAVDAGCLKRNPTLTTEADIKTNSKYCSIFASNHLTNLRTRIANYRKASRNSKAAYKKILKKINPLANKVNRLMAKYRKTKERKYYKQSKRLLYKVNRYYSKMEKHAYPYEKRSENVKEAIVLQVINIFTSGCLENKNLLPELKYLSKHVFFEKINNKLMFSSFSYDFFLAEQKSFQALVHANDFYKAIKIASINYRGDWPPFENMKKDLRDEFKYTNATVAKATPKEVLQIAKKNVVYITRLKPKVACTAELVYKTETDSYFFIAKFFSYKPYSSENQKIQKNNASC